ncbi:TPA_asm: nucleocapsid protein [Triticum virus 1]|uniref:Nucleoprotein n=1 Tax=Triticum virus 1 TaxID=2977997 RepID=A0A9N6YJH1_9RHAB|nr:TPA_asm: nucleocapsid protein [Triticum virus 1]
MEYRGIAGKLKQLTAFLSQQSTSTDTEPVIERTRVQDTVQHDYDARARRLALIKGRTITDRYNDIKNVVSRRGTIKSWDDLRYGKRGCVVLERDDIDMDTLAKYLNALNELFTGLSEKTIATLFVMVYNLRNFSGNYVFENAEAELVDMDESQVADEFSNASFSRESEVSPIMVTEDLKTDREISNAINSCCFIATSYLRMLSREASNYQGAGDALKNTYPAFFNRELGIKNFMPKLQTLKMVKNVILQHDIFKHTSYVLLYAGEVCNLGVDMKEFLYKNHIQNTGLHAYSLFLRVADAYDVDHATLANHLCSTVFTKQLDSLRDLINECVAKEGTAESTLMWKFARIYDNRFFSTLQTKVNARFVAILAYLLRMGAPTRANEDVLQISHVRNLSAQDHHYCETYATAISEFLTYGRSDGHMAVLLEDAL